MGAPQPTAGLDPRFDGVPPSGSFDPAALFPLSAHFPLPNSLSDFVFRSFEYVFTSNELPALGLEIFFTTFLWSLLQSLEFKLWKPYLEAKPYWPRLASRAGFALPDHQREIVYLLSIVPHHLLAGTFMFLGWKNGDSNLIRHGILWEAGFNFQDYIMMALRRYPYDSGISGKGIMVLIVHHFGGLLFGWAVIRSPLVELPDVHLLCISLETAAWLALALITHS